MRREKRLTTWCIVSVVLMVSATGRSGDARARPRALLLQQAHAGNERTLFALRETGFDTTWVNKDTASELPTAATAWRKRFDVVFFGSLALEGGLDKVLSPEQLGALKQFVEQGGGLVTVIGEAARTLSELLPLTVGPGAGSMEFSPVVVMPGHPVLASLPPTWPLFGSRWNSFSRAEAKTGADVLLEVPAKYANRNYPFLAAWSYGQGKVVCLNSLWAFSTGRHFQNWEWAPAFFAQAGRWAAGLPPLPPEAVLPLSPLWFWCHEREGIPEAEKHLAQPVVAPDKGQTRDCLQITLGTPGQTRIEGGHAPPRVEEDTKRLQVRFDNGVTARISKQAMVAYSIDTDVVLALEPVTETPHILYSGDAQATVTNADDGEFAVLREALPEPKPGHQAFRYLRHRIQADGIEVDFEIRVDNRPEGTLTWSFVPRTMLVEGVEWRGIGESFRISSPRLFVENIIPRHRWAMGGTVDGHATFRSGCYSNPRGFRETRFDDATSQDAGHVRWFSSGQPFQMLGSPRGTIWCYAETPALVASWLANQAGSGHIRMVTNIHLGRQRGEINTPVLWYLYASTLVDHNLWLSCYDFLREKYRTDFSIAPMHPKPMAMMRFANMGFTDLRRYANALLPLASKLGFRRVDCGVNYVHAPLHPEHGGIEALKALCDQAHEADMEVFFYCASAWAKKDFPPLQEHPEWIVRGRDGKPQETGYPDLYALSLRSGWRPYSLSRYAELREHTGMDGVWLDSWTMPNEYINYAEPIARPTVVEALEYVKAIQDLGYTVLVEGQSPAALDSFWYRHDRYAPFTGSEFALSNTTPFAYAGDGLFHLDLFRLLSYQCAMFQDPRLLARPDDPLTEMASHCNHLMNHIHDTIGPAHRVRETASGTVWECKDGYALFGHHTQELDVSLPAGEHDVTAIDSPSFTLLPGDDGRAHIRGVLAARGILLVRCQEL